MQSIPVVVQCFFCRGSDVPDNPNFAFGGPLEFLGLPIWAPEGRGVYVWSVDMVSANDERWVVLGPFESDVAAKEAVRVVLALDSSRGYRIENEHSFVYKLARLPYRGLPSIIYTDG
jgi:hypothetical protein